MVGVTRSGVTNGLSGAILAEVGEGGGVNLILGVVVTEVHVPLSVGAQVAVETNERNGLLNVNVLEVDGVDGGGELVVSTGRIPVTVHVNHVATGAQGPLIVGFPA